MGRIDEGRGRASGEATELQGDLLEREERGIGRGRLQEEVGLDVEGGEDPGKKTSLLVSRQILVQPISRKRRTKVRYVSISAFHRLIIASLCCFTIIVVLDHASSLSFSAFPGSLPMYRVFRFSSSS